MIKRAVLTLLSLLLIVTLIGCGGNAKPEDPESSQTAFAREEESQEENQKKEQKPDETNSTNIQDNHSKEEVKVDKNVLVAYFSCTNTTKSLAEYAAEILDADLYEIVPEEPYTEEDLAYYTNGRADREQNDSAARPAILGIVEDMDSYDTIILGYPIWHGQAPRIISTFLESYDFSGKTIIPFCTSHSSGMGSSTINLHALCPDSTEWLDGRRFEGGASKETIIDWLEDIR